VHPSTGNMYLDDSCSPSSTVSTLSESVVQKKWIFVSDDSPVKVKQINQRKGYFCVESKRELYTKDVKYFHSMVVQSFRICVVKIIRKI
jgi:hypothetical protein